MTLTKQLPMKREDESEGRFCEAESSTSSLLRRGRRQEELLELRSETVVISSDSREERDEMLSAKDRNIDESRSEKGLASSPEASESELYVEPSEPTTSPAACKLERKPSLRRKLGALIRGSADLPAAINRSLQPIRRSLSFGKGLDQHQRQKLAPPSLPIPSTTQQQQQQHRRKPPIGKLPPRTRSVQWYSSLCSLAEIDDATNTVETGLLAGETMLENDEPIAVCKRRFKAKFAAPYGRHSDCYDSFVAFNLPPSEAGSLPLLTADAVIGNGSKSETSWSQSKQQVTNGWGNLRLCTQNSSFVRVISRSLETSSAEYSGRESVRSRSLTQLDALGASMLDTGEHNLDTSNSSTQQQQQQQQNQPQPQQQQQYQTHHHQSHYSSQHFGESSPRFLVPNAAPTNGSRPNRARHKLSRSQVSSSEYFSVSFEVGDETCIIDREEFLPATKGTYLAEVLAAACERRGVDLSRVDVLLDSFTAPLPLHSTETSCLGGKHLRVTAKDEKSTTRSASQKTHNVSFRKSGSSYRSRSGRFFSASTEDSSLDSDVSGTVVAGATAKSSTPSGSATSSLKASKQRWSGFFTNTKGTKMELLAEQLNGYTKHGVPRLPDALQLYDIAPIDEGLFSLENDWREIVESSELLSEKQQQQQTALWELAQTEAAYIRTLKVVTDLFMACLYGLQTSNILIEVDKAKLFSNIPEIYAANRYFWTEHIAAMLHAARSTRQPLDPGYLLLGFENFEKIFAPYSRYLSEQKKCQQYCRDRLNDNDLFTAYLAWCETQKDCNRLKLLDILVKPMQRMTKYSLLLKAVYKNTENEEQRAELTVMIKSVDTFVMSVDAALERKEETARLISAASRLESYDVVESRDEELDKLIKFHSNLDIVSSPMPGCPKGSLRTLLREGDLKLRDAATSKTEVHLLLMTDMLLICKQTTKKASSSSSSSSAGSGLKVIRQPYVVDRIRIHELKEPSSLGLVYLNEYNAASAALVLSAGEPKIAKSWMDSIRKAQQHLTMLRHADFEVDEICEGLPRTPRGSSRASRVSSLAHSHSGSVEMEGASPGGSNFLPSYNPSRNVSVETTEPPRASSVSSDESAVAESAAVAASAAAAYNHRQLQIRRSLLSKSPTPNTLSVQVPAYSSLGQSLPNLTLATSPQMSTVSPTPPSSLLIVPQITKSKDTLLSPGHRGISYPPPSPPRGALRRAFAIPQSRNPPLIKTRHVNASVGQTLQTTISLDTETIEERRRRLEPIHRMASTSSIAEEKK